MSKNDENRACITKKNIIISFSVDFYLIMYKNKYFPI